MKLQAPKKVLFLCTSNSCRSQMAEAIVNDRLGDEWLAVSAGTQPSGYVHPKAIQVLAEWAEAFQCFGFLGALHATSQQIATVTNDTYINGYSVAELLCKLAVDFRDLPITLVMDNARYQRCYFIMDLATALGIELLFLPPYSPNLNLIERFWKYVKKSCLYSEYYETLPDFKQVILNTITDPCKQILSSFLTLNFQTFNSVTL